MSKGTNAMLIHETDTVVTLMEGVQKGQDISWICNGENKSVAALEDIQKYHKAAVCDISAGTQVVKYGENIGRALEDIKAGAWVHTHNLSDLPEA